MQSNRMFSSVITISALMFGINAQAAELKTDNRNTRVDAAHEKANKGSKNTQSNDRTKSQRIVTPSQLEKMSPAEIEQLTRENNQ